MSENEFTRQSIEYIRREVPEFAVPSYPGQRYSGLVPDTLDLQERAALAINGITGPADPDADWEIYFSVYFGRNPPVMAHDISDEVQGKLQEALPLMRLVSGSDLRSEVDQCWMHVTLKMQGPDGLLYTPIKGRPWYGFHCGCDMTSPDPNKLLEGRLPPVGYRPRLSTMPREIAQAGCIGSPVFNGRALGALALYHELTADDLWAKAGRDLVDGLAGITQSPFWPGDRRSTEAPLAAANPWILDGLCHFYRTTGYERALELATWAANRLKSSAWVHDGGAMEESFIGREHKSGSAGRPPFGWASGAPGRKHHFHSTTYALLGMLEYAVTVGDHELMALVREGYEFARVLGQQTLGFFPERVADLWSESIEDRTDIRYESGETCQVADMIALALKLTEAGQGDYWDDADRWLRNQFAESQMTDAQWVDHMTEDLPRTSYDQSYQCVDQVPQRCLGTFAGWPSANDWYTAAHHTRGYYPEYPGQAIMQCCMGNAARTLYYAWQRSLDYRDGQLRVNLLVNRASPWADVDSCIPYEGRADIRVKHACELSVRIPEWAATSETFCQVNDAPRSCQWDGRYACLGPVRPGDVAEISFPIPLATEDISVQGRYYKIVRKGNEVLLIDPPGKYCPFYQRAHYRADSVRYRKATRFVADKMIHW